MRAASAAFSAFLSAALLPFAPSSQRAASAASAAAAAATAFLSSLAAFLARPDSFFALPPPVHHCVKQSGDEVRMLVGTTKSGMRGWGEEV